MDIGAVFHAEVEMNRLKSAVNMVNLFVIYVQLNK